MTPTEKKYRKNVGKRFIMKTVIRNSSGHLDLSYKICTVYGIARTGQMGNTGAYVYKIKTLPWLVTTTQMEYDVRCTDFLNGWDVCSFEELTDENKHLVM